MEHRASQRPGEDRCDDDDERPRLPIRQESQGLHPITIVGHQHGLDESSLNKRSEMGSHRPLPFHTERRDSEILGFEKDSRNPCCGMLAKQERQVKQHSGQSFEECAPSRAEEEEPSKDDKKGQVHMQDPPRRSVKEESEITSEKTTMTSRRIVLPLSGEEDDDEHEEQEEEDKQARTPTSTQERRVLNRRNHWPPTRPGAVRVGGQRVNGDEEDGTVVIGPSGDTVVGPSSGDTVVVVPAFPGFVVPEPQPPDKKHNFSRWRAVLLCLLVISIPGLALGLGFGLSKRNSSKNNSVEEGTPPPAPILTKWIVIGQPDDIVGDTQYDHLGTRLAISGDGNTIAAASTFNSALIQPYIVTFSVTRNSTQPLANRIESPLAVDYFGFGLSLSHDGRVLVTGSANGIFVYRLDGLPLNQSWMEQGLISERGLTPALSLDGSTAAVGFGEIRVYRYDQLEERNAWSQVGQVLWRERDSDLFGYSKDLSANGNRLAVGLPGNLNSTGRVRVFDLLVGLDGTHWNQIGNDISGIAEFDAFGIALSLSGDGSCVAVGAIQNVDVSNGGADFQSSTRPGYAQVHCLQGSEWVQRGQRLEGGVSLSFVDGEPHGSMFGRSLDLSGDGRTLVVGAPLAEGGPGVGTGQVSIFRFVDDSDLWIQVAEFNDLGEQTSVCGATVSMSFDGDVVAAGCPRSAGVGGRFGHGVVRVLREVPCEDEDVLTPDNLTPCRQQVGARV